METMEVDYLRRINTYHSYAEGFGLAIVQNAYTYFYVIGFCCFYQNVNQSACFGTDRGLDTNEVLTDNCKR